LPIQILTIDHNKKISKKDILNLDDLKMLMVYCKANKNENGDKKSD